VVKGNKSTTSWRPLLAAQNRGVLPSSLSAREEGRRVTFSSCKVQRGVFLQSLLVEQARTVVQQLHHCRLAVFVSCGGKVQCCHFARGDCIDQGRIVCEQSPRSCHVHWRLRGEGLFDYRGFVIFTGQKQNKRLARKSFKLCM